MAGRKNIITKNWNINDLQGLPCHPNVRKCWQLPREYMLFEFYHPVYDRIFSSDFQIKHAALKEESVRLESAWAVAELRRMLQPLFGGKPKSFQGTQLLFPGKTAFTLFLGEGKVLWPEVKLAEGWETDRQSKFHMRLVIATEDTTRELEKIVRLWGESGMTQGEIGTVSPVRFQGEEAQVECSFINEAHDSIMALYMLLTDTRALTSLESLERLKI
jgi:hypothetical protein